MKATNEKREYAKGFAPEILQATAELERFERLQSEFAYVRELSRHQQRMAAFWEYARESKELREFGRLLRESQLSEEAPNAFRRFVRKHGIDKILVSEQALLLGSLGFPEFSFKTLLQAQLLPAELLTNRRFGISGMVCASLNQFLQGLWQFKLPLHIGTEKTYGLLIPSSHTDAELSKEFRELLQQLRPADCPEPKRAGRSGRSSPMSPLDMLKQLAAFRLEREGFTFYKAIAFFKEDDHRERIPYFSEKGWTLAVGAAKDRIENMIKVPFFQRHFSNVRK